MYLYLWKYIRETYLVPFLKKMVDFDNSFPLTIFLKRCLIFVELKVLSFALKEIKIFGNILEHKLEKSFWSRFRKYLCKYFNYISYILLIFEEI